MKVKIKEFRGSPVTSGFFPVAGVKLLPGQEYEFEDEDAFHAALESDLVEAIVEKKIRRRRKVSEEDQPGE